MECEGEKESQYGDRSIFKDTTPKASTTRRVCETRMPPAATKSKYDKNPIVPKSHILNPPHHPQGHMMSEPINERTVQVWLLYHHPNFKFKHCTLLKGRIYVQTDGQTDDPITTCRCPRRTLQAWAYKGLHGTSSSLHSSRLYFDRRAMTSSPFWNINRGAGPSACRPPHLPVVHH